MRATNDALVPNIFAYLPARLIEPFGCQSKINIYFKVFFSPERSKLFGAHGHGPWFYKHINFKAVFFA